MIESARGYLAVMAQVLGLAGVIYEAFWEGGKNPVLLKFFGGLLVGGTTVSVPWTSLLRGFHLRIEIRDPVQAIPTLTVDLGNLEKQLAQPPKYPSGSPSLPKLPTESPPQPLSNEGLSVSSEPSPQ